MSRQQTLTIRTRIKHCTDSAVLTECGAWLPLSLIEVAGDVPDWPMPDGPVLLELPEWLILKRGLEDLVEE